MSWETAGANLEEWSAPPCPSSLQPSLSRSEQEQGQSNEDSPPFAIPAQEDPRNEVRLLRAEEQDPGVSGWEEVERAGGARTRPPFLPLGAGFLLHPTQISMVTMTKRLY